jgi:hypothetical protein
LVLVSTIAFLLPQSIHTPHCPPEARALALHVLLAGWYSPLSPMSFVALHLLAEGLLVG